MASLVVQLSVCRALSSVAGFGGLQVSKRGQSLKASQDSSVCTHSIGLAVVLDSERHDDIFTSQWILFSTVQAFYLFTNFLNWSPLH